MTDRHGQMPHKIQSLQGRTEDEERIILCWLPFSPLF